MEKVILKNGICTDLIIKNLIVNIIKKAMEYVSYVEGEGMKGKFNI
jgi:hypothetical protein